VGVLNGVVGCEWVNARMRVVGWLAVWLCEERRLETHNGGRVGVPLQPAAASARAVSVDSALSHTSRQRRTE
jgi:hypothetical protein